MPPLLGTASPSFRKRCLGLLALVCTTLPASTAAQSAEPGAISILAALQQERCAAASPSGACRWITDAITAAQSGQRDVVWQLLQRLEAAVQRDRNDAIAWLALGTARWMAHDLVIPAHAAPLQDLGESYPAAAGNALVRALQLDSTLSGAVDALAFLPLPREGASRLQARSDVLWQWRDRLGPVALAASASVQREAGHRDRAVAIWQAAIDAGAPAPGRLQMEMSRDLFAQGDTAAAAVAYFRGAADTAAVTANVYRRQLQWVATPVEMVRWDSLPAEGRAGWLRGFWRGRDAMVGRQPGERLIEHFRRLEVALKDYRIALPASGRQLARSTARASEFLPVELALHELRTTAGSTGDEVADAANAEMLQLTEGDAVTMGSRSMLATYRPTQDLIDDRGVIFVRHGAPDALARTVGGIALELWRYDRGDASMLLSFKEVDFDGQAAASVLVPSLIGEDALLRDQVCHLELTLCSTNADPSIRDDKAKVLARARADASRYRSGVTTGRLRAEGLSSIERAVTTDANPVTSKTLLHPVVQFHALRNVASGEDLLLATFAVAGKELPATRPAEAAGRYVYPIRLRLAATRRSDGDWHQADTLRRFASERPLVEGQYLTGIVTTSLASGSWMASLNLSTTGDAAATAANDKVGYVAGLSMWLSDLVLGRPGGGTTWFSGTRAVPLNPLNAFRRSDQVALYYQVGNTRRGDSLTVRIDVLEIGREAAGLKVALSFQESAPGGLLESSRTLGIEPLAPGRYLIRVAVRSGAEELVTESRLTVVE